MKKYWYYYVGLCALCLTAGLGWYYSSTPSRTIASSVDLSASADKVNCAYRSTFHNTDQELIDDYNAKRVKIYSGIAKGENFGGCAKMIIIDTKTTANFTSSIVYLTKAKMINNTKYCIYKDLEMLNIKIEFLSGKNSGDMKLNAGLICESLD